VVTRRIEGPLVAARTIATAGALFVACLLPSCGQKGDPKAPYVRTPRPPEGLVVSQRGASIEIRVKAPATTTEARPLPVVELYLLGATEAGDFDRMSREMFRERVAPGETRTQMFEIPAKELRVAARATDGRARSTLSSIVTFKPGPIPVAPTGLAAENTSDGVALRWSNPPGIEPFLPNPIAPAVEPELSGEKRPGATSEKSPDKDQDKGREAGPGHLPQEEPNVPLDKDAAKPRGSTAPPPAQSSPSPRPTPPPRGIRLFRTDGAREQIVGDPIRGASFLDKTVRQGERACYVVRYATTLAPLVESEPSNEACLQVKDIAAPEAPASLTADQSEGFVEIVFVPSASRDAVAHRVYRERGGTRALIATVPSPGTRARDADVLPGPASYFASAVDAAGNESPLTAPFRLVVR
jgi:hypothetical protein